MAASAGSLGGLPLALPWERRRACKLLMARLWLLHGLIDSPEAPAYHEGYANVIQAGRSIRVESSYTGMAV
eukprot:6186680-Pleurochrysis_carterae.AAC.1